MHSSFRSVVFPLTSSFLWANIALEVFLCELLTKWPTKCTLQIGYCEGKLWHFWGFNINKLNKLQLKWLLIFCSASILLSDFSLQFELIWRISRVFGCIVCFHFSPFNQLKLKIPLGFVVIHNAAAAGGAAVAVAGYLKKSLSYYANSMYSVTPTEWNLLRKRIHFHHRRIIDMAEKCWKTTNKDLLENICGDWSSLIKWNEGICSIFYALFRLTWLKKRNNTWGFFFVSLKKAFTRGYEWFGLKHR